MGAAGQASRLELPAPCLLTLEPLCVLILKDSESRGSRSVCAELPLVALSGAALRCGAWASHHGRLLEEQGR